MNAIAVLAVLAFALAYGFVVFEETTGLSKSKSMLVAAIAIWVLIAAFAPAGAQPPGVAFRRVFLDYAELFFFLVVAMTFIAAMAERRVFDVLRAALTRRGPSYRQLFWITGALAFVSSSVIPNLTIALVMGAVVIALGRGNRAFIAPACVNLVVASNAGGAWCAFGDVTTIMVWQQHRAEFFDFFRLFLPALVDFLLPAVLMHGLVPRGGPGAFAEPVEVLPGGWAICATFALAIAFTVGAEQALGLPPVFGMLGGLALLSLLSWAIARREGAAAADDGGARFDLHRTMAAADWDTLLFFGGVVLCIGGFAQLGLLRELSALVYGSLGPTAANAGMGLVSALVDNIPIMYAVLEMNPAMGTDQWLLATLTTGVGGSLLSIGSPAGVALMGAARGMYTFNDHLRFAPAILVGYAASVFVQRALSH